MSTSGYSPRSQYAQACLRVFREAGPEVDLTTREVYERSGIYIQQDVSDVLRRLLEAGVILRVRPGRGCHPAVWRLA